MTDAAREHRITHIGVCVSDLERSVRFYTEGLGFVERARLDVDDDETPKLLGLPALDLQMVYLDHSGLRIELLHYREPGHTGDGTPRPMNLLGMTHLSIRVDDLDALSARMADAGGTVLGETLATFPTGNRGLMVLDPDGLRIELIERNA